MLIRKVVLRCLFLYVVIFGISAYGQAPDYQVNTDRKVSFPSPNAASLGKYGFIPVNFSTGMANISIPIWEIKENDISLPIQLSYNNNGLRVSEEASWVGFGWSLMAGGSITRTVRGGSDLEAGRLNGKHYDELNNPQGIDNLTANRIVEQYYDGEPDLFTFNAGGHSGKFILYKNQVIPIPFNDLKIVRDGDNFKITDNDGVVYVFSKREVSSTNSASQAFNLPSYVSSWLLTSITSANGADVIDFIYSSSPEVVNSASNYGVQHIFSGNPGPYSSATPCGDRRTSTSNNALSTVSSWRLERIRSRSTEIVFIPKETDRLDLFGNSRALSEVLIYERQANTLVKKFKFNTSYFGDTSSKSTARLRLDNLVEYSSGTSYVEPHYFEYYGDVGISKTSFSMDHWGYFNGAGNLSLIPHKFDWQNFGDADREPNSGAAQNGILKKIIYPTKGSSEFVYEQNEQVLNGNKIPGPGLRVLQIKNFDGNKTVYKKYEYDDPISVGAPSYVSQYVNATCICINGSGTGCLADTYDCTIYVVKGDNTSLYGSLSGFAHAYKKVVEVNGLNRELGSTEYIYEPSASFEFDRDMKLKEKIVKDYMGVTQSKVTNSYTDVQDFVFRAFRPYLTKSYSRICSFPEGTFEYDQEYKYYLNDYEWDAMYLVFSTWTYLNKSIETNYVNGIPGIVKEVNNSYTSTINHRMLTEIKTNQSDGSREVQWMKYVDDYNLSASYGNDPNYNALKKMKELNVRNRVIELQKRSVDVANVASVVDGKMMLYRNYESENNIQLAEIHSLQQNDNLAVSQSSTSNSSFVFNHLPYRKDVSYTYNIAGRLVEKRTDAIINSFLWGYNNTVPIASCTGVSYTDLSTYFSQSNSDLNQLHNHSSLIGKPLTTYTYLPLIGISSIKDQNGFRTVFDYDVFGRLLTIRDHNNHILKAFQYNYKLARY